MLAAVALIFGIGDYHIAVFCRESVSFRSKRWRARVILAGQHTGSQLDTSGLGVGFGTEFIRRPVLAASVCAIRPSFPKLGGARLFHYDTQHHLRPAAACGHPGLALFVMWAGHLASETPDGSTSALRRDAALKSLALIYSLFNPAASISMMGIIGVSAVLGCRCCTKPVRSPKEGAFEWLS